MMSYKMFFDGGQKRRQYVRTDRFLYMDTSHCQTLGDHCTRSPGKLNSHISDAVAVFSVSR